MKILNKFVVIWIVALTSCGIWAQTETYPSRPIHLIVPFPAGGAADIVARVLAQPLSERLGQPVIVDNKPGADGIVAADAVAKSDPDGYTLFMATYGALSAVPFLHKSIPYDVLVDFTPITATGNFSFFLFAHPSVPVHDLSELIHYIHQNPGRVNYGTGNVGSIVATAELAQRNHLDMQHVPYKGEVPAMNDFLAGRIQLMLGTPTNALPWVRDGKLKALAALSDTRSSLLPEVPTLHELDMPNLSIVPWSGIFGPAHMPSNIVRQLNAALNSILRDKEVQLELSKQAFEPRGSTSQELQRYVQLQLRVWERATHIAGLKAE